MTVVEVHCNLRVDPSGSGVVGLSQPVVSREAMAFKMGLWRERAFMAQSDSASPSEGEGSGFESR